jgi:RNA polymerase sigma factor (sigma-70 family)
VDDLRDPQAFGALYRAHAVPLTAYFLRRTGDAETAADLTAETFAAALDGAARFDPARGAPVGWLYGIARHQLALWRRRGHVEDRARRRLGMERLEPTPAALERLVEAAEREATAIAVRRALEQLPDEQRDAVTARVVDGAAYEDIATTSGATAPAARQRVSRALTRLRSGLTGKELL